MADLDSQQALRYEDIEFTFKQWTLFDTPTKTRVIGCVHKTGIKADASLELSLGYTQLFEAITGAQMKVPPFESFKALRAEIEMHFTLRRELNEVRPKIITKLEEFPFGFVLRCERWQRTVVFNSDL